MISLTPKNSQFFDLLEDIGQNLARIAEALRGASQGAQDPAVAAAAIAGHRDASDQAFDRYVDELHGAFVTPIDRDDLYYLGFDLERVVEATERLAARWVTYELPATDPLAVPLIDLLARCCNEAFLALPLLRRRALMGGVERHFREIRRLHREAEGRHRQALQELCRSDDGELKRVLRKEMLDLAMVAMHQCKALGDTYHKAVIRNV